MNTTFAIKLKNSYPKFKDNKRSTVYVYTVDDKTGEYARINGAKTIMEDGVPLYFTTKLLGVTNTLTVSSKGDSLYPDTSKLDQVLSLADQYPNTDMGSMFSKQAMEITMQTLDEMNKHIAKMKSNTPAATIITTEENGKKLGDI